MLSTCRRNKVGCVIVPTDLSRVCAIGYNGPAAGEDDEACRCEEGACGCIHAEANALVKMREPGSGFIIISTVSPCEHCAGLIINSKQVDWVLYDRPYRDTGGLARLLIAGIGAYQIEEMYEEPEDPIPW